MIWHSLQEIRIAESGKRVWLRPSWAHVNLLIAATGCQRWPSFSPRLRPGDGEFWMSCVRVFRNLTLQDLLFMINVYNVTRMCTKSLPPSVSMLKQPQKPLAKERGPWLLADTFGQQGLVSAMVASYGEKRSIIGKHQ